MKKKIERSEGIIIKVVDYDDSATIINVLTEKGIIALYVRGSKKVNSGNAKLNNVLTLINFTHTINNDVNTICEALILDSFKEIKSDLIKYNTTLTILEKILYFRESISNYDILYKFTKNILSLIKKDIDYLKVINIFDVKLLYLLGVAPSLKSCVYCDSLYTNGLFSISEGGVICPKCIRNKNVDSLYLVDSKYLDVIKKLYYGKIELYLDNTLLLNELDYTKEVSNIIDSYYNYHLEFKSKVKEILNKLM